MCSGWLIHESSSSKKFRYIELEFYLVELIDNLRYRQADDPEFEPGTRRAAFILVLNERLAET